MLVWELGCVHSQRYMKPEVKLFSLKKKKKRDNEQEKREIECGLISISH